MYGRDIAQQLMPFETYRMRLLDSNFNRRQYSLDQITPRYSEIDVRVTKNPSVEYFLYLYNRVGRKYQWYMVNYVAPEDMKPYLEQTTLVTLLHNGEPIGFGSYVNEAESTNITYFGLMEQGIGKGYGRHFLADVARSAFDEYKQQNVWLYTTDRDHPNALPSYKAVGFHIENVRTEFHWAPITEFRLDEI